MPTTDALPAIRSVGLAKEYAGGVRALLDFNLEVPRGEVFGLLGQNGAGKTTLIRILLDMIRPTAGQAAVMGLDTQRRGVEARRHIGYLPSSLRFPPGMTSTDLFAFVAGVRSVHPDAAYLDSLVRRLDLNPGRRIDTLSRGNQQKVALIAALMTKPDLLILDEPTSGLDPLMQEVVDEIVREVAADGRTVFFSSHILPEVEALCHEVAVLRAGALVGVFDLAEQRRLAPRLVTVTFAAPAEPDAFGALEGVRVVEQAGARVVFEVTGNLDALVKRLGAFSVVDVEAHEPSLEDFFFALYGATREAPDQARAAAPTGAPR